MTEFHVTPVDDLVAHEQDEDCPCGPMWIRENGNDIYVHNSLDNREANDHA